MRTTSPAFDVESYRGLVVQEAVRVWNRLPLQTRNWLGIEDLVEDGVTWTWQLYRKGKWDPSKGASFGTYVKNHLFKHFDNHFIAVYQEAMGRCEKNTTSIQGLAARYEADGGTFELERLMSQERHVHHIDCEITESILGIYKDATPELRAQMVSWFLLNNKTKITTWGEKFRRHKREFREHARKYGVGINECRHLLRSPICLDQFCRMALWVPYNLDDPSPGVRTKGVTTIANA